MEKITRTIISSEVTVQAYNTDDKRVGTLTLTLDGNFNSERYKEKALRQALPDNIKVLEVLSVILKKTKFSMDLEDFISSAEKGETVTLDANDTGIE